MFWFIHSMGPFNCSKASYTLKSKYYVHNCRRNTTSAVRVRFAPSPTGLMHIGGLRTALFNKFFAVKHNGKFILRIEDTDKRRYNPEALNDISSSLKWSGLSPDESYEVGGNYGPYIQSERRHIYLGVVQSLLESGHAYRCFCSPKRLALLRTDQLTGGGRVSYDNACRELTDKQIQENLSANIPHTIRFMVPKCVIDVEDLVFGNISFSSVNLDGDFIIFKSDGMPVYHLANVVDDHLMEITHVIRGTEWLSSTQKHLLLYKALGWRIPNFAHLPLLLSSSGTKLSKRNSEFSQLGEVRQLRRAGYLPSAILTWLSSTGMNSSTSSDNSGKSTNTYRWSPELEFNHLVDLFNLSRVSHQNAQLSKDVLDLCGRVHFDKAISEAKQYCEQFEGNEAYETPEIISNTRFYLRSILPHEEQASIFQSDKYLAHQLGLSQGRISCLADLADPTKHMLNLWKIPDVSQCQVTINDHYQEIVSIKVICKLYENFIGQLKEVERVNFSNDDLSARLRLTYESVEVKRPTAMHLLRLALIGSESGNPVVELIRTLTISESIRRVQLLHDKLLAMAS